MTHKVTLLSGLKYLIFFFFYIMADPHRQPQEMKYQGVRNHLGDS